MPAAAWAARSGDAALPVRRDSIPAPIAKALREHSKPNVFVLGPESAISKQVVMQLEKRKLARSVRRIQGPNPVENAIAFARFASGGFGWDINDPGHGFVIANAGRPLDAGAAAPLSASGNWGPLLLTEEAGDVPAAMRDYLLDVKPGYVGNPTRAVYNHIWLIGDQNAISVGFQAQIDDLAEVVQVRSGLGSQLGPVPGTPEHEQPKRRTQ